ncbi:MAG: hypothetical protein ABEJ88_07825 [Halobacterium sp.]
MSEDATLDAFADASDAPAESDDDATPAPVTSSYREDGTCSSCGESASRLWQTGEASVCVGCAAWTATGEGACDQ